MDALIGKLTNLSYEFFGVILPGIVIMLFIITWWGALGASVPALTHGLIPQLTISQISEIIQILQQPLGIGLVIPALFFAYFFGHIILWISRGGNPDDRTLRNPWRRVLAAILFRIPKPEKPFDEELLPLLKVVQDELFNEKFQQPHWRQTFPVLKCYIAKNLAYSLIVTYQNKYTLHRSLTSASAILFWLCVSGAPIGLVSQGEYATSPHWGALIISASTALVLVWGFSDSYMYNWKMFGNTIITESFSIICGRNNAKNEK